MVVHVWCAWVSRPPTHNAIHSKQTHTSPQHTQNTQQQPPHPENTGRGRFWPAIWTGWPCGAMTSWRRGRWASEYCVVGGDCGLFVGVPKPPNSHKSKHSQIPTTPPPKKNNAATTTTTAWPPPAAAPAWVAAAAAAAPTARVVVSAACRAARPRPRAWAPS